MTGRTGGRGGRGRVVLSGVLLGLAFATKINVFPLVLASLLWVLIYGRGENLKTSVSRLAAGFGIMMAGGAMLMFWK